MEKATIQSAAAALFEGGWRSKDVDIFKAEYSLPDDEAAAIADEMKKFEA